MNTRKQIEQAEEDLTVALLTAALRLACGGAPDDQVREYIDTTYAANQSTLRAMRDNREGLGDDGITR